MLFRMSDAFLTVVLFLLYLTLLLAPGIGLSWLTWRFSRNLRPVLVQVALRAAALAIGFTPAYWGHNFLPAIVLAVLLHGRDRLDTLLGVLIMWVVATVLLFIRAFYRQSANSSQTIQLIDTILAWITFAIAIWGIVGTELFRNPFSLLDTPLLWLLVAMFNLLRVRNAPGIKSLAIYCIAANLMVVILEAVRFKMWGTFALFGALPISGELILSVRSAMAVSLSE
jgi:hypothetical protein